MILDNEQQRKFLLEMFAQVQFPGTVLDVAYQLKREIQGAPLMQSGPAPSDVQRSVGPHNLADASN